MKKLYELLDVKPGLTCLIGSGGKTSLMYHLAGELSRSGTVLITTTTHIRVPGQFPLAETMEEVHKAFLTEKIVCAGTREENGKLAIPSFEGWKTAADYVLVEADGSKQLPLKAHRPTEPVIPEECGNIICVVGLSGLDQPILAAAHCAEHFAELAGAKSTGAKVTAEMVAAVIEKENLCARVFLNQTDALPKITGGWKAKDLANELNRPVVSGSLRQGIFQKLK